MQAHVDHIMVTLKKSNKDTGYKMTEGSFHSILQGYFGYTSIFADACCKEACRLELVTP